MTSTDRTEETERDYLPDIFEQFRRDYPELSKAYDDLSSRMHDVGPLDPRTRRLVKLGAAIGVESQGAVRSHVRKALNEGMSPQEIEHAILLSLTTVGFPAMIAALKWARQVIDARR
jgi:4-carboxymuconolactone decarboxylase